MDDDILVTIPRKYNLESNEDELTKAEKNALLPIKVIDVSHDPVGEYLYWKVTHSSLCKEYESFKAGNLHQMSSNLHFLTTEERVPDPTRLMAKQWLGLILDDIEKKYSKDTGLSELSRCEYIVLQDIRPLLEIDSVAYSDTIKALHWKVVEKQIDSYLEKLEADHDFEIQNIRWLILFQINSNTPEFIRNKALKLRKLNEKYVIERLSKEFDMQSDVHDLTETEKIVLDRLDVIRNNYPPVVECLHWKVVHIFLCKEFDDFKAGNLPGYSLNFMPKKLKFLMTNDRVPDKTKDKAREFNKILM